MKRLADRLGLNGITFNTSGALVVEVDAVAEAQTRSFLDAIRAEAPTAARIEGYRMEEIAHNDPYHDFRIAPSPPRDGSFTLISPDLSICPECASEIGDPTNRRFGYPFTNCTNCGPRYSITLSTPYDRANTTMREFPLCADCAAEYRDPANRRFHAEPVACAVCGPRVSMPIAAAIDALQDGQILAIKGLGGFQLACDAFWASAVDGLRTRKRRSRKPFAVMMRDLATVERLCILDQAERQLLCSAAAPVVLLAMRDPGAFPSGIAPGLTQIGVMLPYTPLHQLLFAGTVTCMVMTSGNMSEEPIVIGNDEAVTKLCPLADQLLLHNRNVFMRVDDSVTRVFEGVPRVLRRARGYAPSAITLAHEVGEVLAAGAELKNTFCITKGRYAIPSQHIGDLENYETLQFFEEAFRNLQSVYQASPRLIAHDLHPDYLSTRWALRRPEQKLPVQHHHAHIASCMAENDVTDRVIGVVFDGAGFGTDGQVWGGEFLVCNHRGFERWAHLRYVALPGGDACARQGWRMAAAHLHDALGPDYRKLDLPCWNFASPQQWRVIDRMLERPTVRTSSCGRLFDAVSAICGIAAESSYEGEAAMLLENAARRIEAEDFLPFVIDPETNPWTIDTRTVVRAAAEKIAAGHPSQLVARCFHDSVGHMIEAVCRGIRERSEVNKVCLSGGVFQNFTLLSVACVRLRRSGFQVFLHAKVPPNDGGLSLGQAVIAAAFLEGQAKT